MKRVGTCALTVNDVRTVVDRAMVVTDVRLEVKSAGVHGDWHRN